MLITYISQRKSFIVNLSRYISINQKYKRHIICEEYIDKRAEFKKNGLTCSFQKANLPITNGHKPEMGGHSALLTKYD